MSVLVWAIFSINSLSQPLPGSRRDSILCAGVSKHQQLAWDLGSRAVCLECQQTGASGKQAPAAVSESWCMSIKPDLACKLGVEAALSLGWVCVFLQEATRGVRRSKLTAGGSGTQLRPVWWGVCVCARVPPSVGRNDAEEAPRARCRTGLWLKASYQGHPQWACGRVG